MAFGNSQAPESRFFANSAVQRSHPHAFVLQPEAETYLRSLEAETKALRDRLVAVISQDSKLSRAIQNWRSLSTEEQIPFLKRVFELEVEVMNIDPPELIIDAKSIPGRAAYFDFNIERPGPGQVLLNPEVLAGMDKYAALALLIHETRHSAQFQMAFTGASQRLPHSSAASVAYQASFRAQKDESLEIRSFCDFLTLANEFEAFQFGNDVLGQLTNGKVDLSDMGTFASQYNDKGRLKLDLVELLDNGKPGTLLEKFNEAEITQCRQLGYCDNQTSPQPPL